MDRAGASPHVDRARKAGILAVVTLVASLTVGVSIGGPAHAVAPSPQIAGSPAAPTASEISPVSKLVTPTGGVENFAATATDLYVYTGSQLAVYTLGGAPVTAFALPASFGSGDEVSQPVIDPSGNIYLSSYYGTAVDKFSPTGSLLWSVDPQHGNPTALFAVGTGGNWRLMVSLVQSGGASLVLDPTTGSVSGTFPLVSGIGDFVTQEAGGNLLFSGNGYVETVSPTGQVLSTFGAATIEGNGAHTGSGSQFYYPGQAVQGPDGTIYTADPLYTMEATAPNGLLQG